MLVSDDYVISYYFYGITHEPGRTLRTISLTYRRRYTHVMLNRRPSPSRLAATAARLQGGPTSSCRFIAAARRLRYGPCTQAYYIIVDTARHGAEPADLFGPPSSKSVRVSSLAATTTIQYIITTIIIPRTKVYRTPVCDRRRGSDIIRYYIDCFFPPTADAAARPTTNATTTTTTLIACPSRGLRARRSGKNHRDCSAAPRLAACNNDSRYAQR